MGSRRPALFATLFWTAGCGDVSVPLLVRLASGGTDDAGSVSVAPTEASLDASLDATVGEDGAAPIDAAEAAGDDAGDARVLGAFGAVSLVVPLSDPNADDEDPTFTGDQLELYFMSNRTGSQDIWSSKRKALTDPWGPPVRVSELSTPATDRGPAVSLDGLTIWFSSNRDDDAGTGMDIWVSSRPNVLAPWAPPTRVTELSSSGADEAPAVDEAALVIVFMSDRAGGIGGLDLYMASRTTVSAPWGPPVNLVDINTTGDEWDPFIGDMDRQLFWAANKPKEEIRQSTRSSSSQPFPHYRVLSELGTPDFDPTFSIDLRHVMFGSSRSGNQDIYEAFR